MEQRTDITLFAERIDTLRRQISQVIVGQDDNIDLLLTAVLATQFQIIYAFQAGLANNITHLIFVR